MDSDNGLQADYYCYDTNVVPMAWSQPMKAIVMTNEKLIVEMKTNYYWLTTWLLTVILNTVLLLKWPVTMWESESQWPVMKVTKENDETS